MKKIRISTKVLDKIGLLSKALEITKFPYPSIEISDNAIMQLKFSEAVKIGLFSQELADSGKIKDDEQIIDVQGTEYPDVRT